MTSEVAASKRALRERMRRDRPQLAPAARDAVGAALARALVADARVQRASQVALFAADATEPPTRASFEALIERGVRCLFPRVEPEALAFASVERWEDLVPGRFGILAPDPSRPAVALGPGDVALVPGLAFDAEGGRLGRGGGFYDRTFPPGRPGPWLIGMAFARQVVERVPRDSRDRAMDAIVTEDGLRWVEAG